LQAQAGLPAEPLGWQVSSSMFAHPTTNSINIVGKVIGGFVFAANMFSFVLVVSHLRVGWAVAAGADLRCFQR